MSLAFFAKKQYLDRKKGRIIHCSSLIRAEQIAGYLGAKLNPVSGYENDVCIYVKPGIKKDGTPYDKFKSQSYIDMIDLNDYMRWLRKYPELFGIVPSQYSHDILKGKVPNKIVFIPQQHCNFENFIRGRKVVANVGIIGTPGAFRYSTDETSKRLEHIGLKLITNYDYQTREDVVNFYKNIDIQIVWETKYRLLKNPLKIINAASFGIPTVGYPHKGYKEVDGYYVKALTIDQLIEEVGKLKNPNNYEIASKNLLQIAEKYHISKIAEMYKQLET